MKNQLGITLDWMVEYKLSLNIYLSVVKCLYRKTLLLY